MGTNPTNRSNSAVRDLAWLANGYFDACEFLCSAMVEDKFHNDTGRVMAVLFLCHHAVELHFKAAILAKGQKPPNIHDLAELDRTYARLYPRSPVEPPPIIKKLAYLDAGLFPETAVSLKGRLHERFRYVYRKDGTTWPKLPEFDPKIFENDLAKLKKAIWPVLMPLLYGKRI